MRTYIHIMASPKPQISDLSGWWLSVTTVYETRWQISTRGKTLQLSHELLTSAPEDAVLARHIVRRIIPHSLGAQLIYCKLAAFKHEDPADKWLEYAFRKSMDIARCQRNAPRRAEEWFNNFTLEEWKADLYDAIIGARLHDNTGKQCVQRTSLVEIEGTRERYETGQLIPYKGSLGLWY